MHTISSSSIRFPVSYLREFTARAFLRSGLSDEDALQASDVLCTADEWGIRSHGLARLRSYYEMLSSGRINRRPKPRLVRELASLALVDGDNGLGLTVGAFANRLAIEKSKDAGSAWVSVRNSNHFGIAGYYSVQGLAEDLIGMALSNTPPIVAPFGGMERMLGTNPIAAAFPAHLEKPLIIDLATSAISLGAVENAKRDKKGVAPACMIDAAGVPSLEPDDFFRGGALLSLGGSRESGGHKGYCLSALVDILCGPLAGAAWGPFVPSFLNNSPAPVKSVGEGIGHLFGSIWIGAFDDPIVFKKSMDTWIQTMRNSEPSPGCPSVLVPGDPEHAAALESKTLGVALDPIVLNDLTKLGEELGIPFG